MVLIARTAAHPIAVAPAVQAAVHEIDPTLPVSEIYTMEEVRSLAIGRLQLAKRLLTGFAAVALALAALGVFGVTAYSVAQRACEVAVRIALGAVRPSILRLILAQELRAPIVGVVLGVIGALLLTSWLDSLLFQVAPRDPLTFALVAAILLAVATLACYLPVRRAARIDPMQALRRE